MKKILFICHGNICRSVTAEFVMRRLAEEAGLSSQIAADSAATSSEEIGNPIYPPTLQTLRRHGIEKACHRARQVTAEDYGRFDLLVVMDGANLRELKRIIAADPEGKVRRLLDRDVADPWYTRDFERCYADIAEGCGALLGELADGIETE